VVQQQEGWNGANGASCAGTAVQAAGAMPRSKVQAGQRAPPCTCSGCVLLGVCSWVCAPEEVLLVLRAGGGAAGLAWAFTPSPALLLPGLATCVPLPLKPCLQHYQPLIPAAARVTFRHQSFPRPQAPCQTPPVGGQQPLHALLH